MQKVLISNWGNYPKIEAEYISFSTVNKAIDIIKNNSKLIPRGLGRCYGDSALSETIINTLKFNRILDFNEETGILTCECGVSIEDIIETFMPKGWCMPVTPGTKYVTIGGAIASDVHGKNHHVAGSISNHIITMDILTPEGEIITCSKDNNEDLFWSSCGGMGLTGLILSASFKLKKIETSYIKQQIVKARNIDHIIDIFEESREYPYSVAWIDCLAKGQKMGRSLMIRGHNATLEDIKNTPYAKNPLQVIKKKKLNIPVNFPNLALNNLSVKAFNFLYYNKQFNSFQENIVDYDKFFYPLDGINNWNRIYGKRGFTQYQFVLGMDKSRDGMKRMLTEISKSGEGSFLAVLKLFGPQDDLISFPKEGYFLALDFPIKEKVFKLLDKLDNIALEHDGRLYLTKDARMSKRMFQKSYDNFETFKNLKEKFDPQSKFKSLQSERIGL